MRSISSKWFVYLQFTVPKETTHAKSLGITWDRWFNFRHPQKNHLKKIPSFHCQTLQPIAEDKLLLFVEEVLQKIRDFDGPTEAEFDRALDTLKREQEPRGEQMTNGVILMRDFFLLFCSDAVGQLLKPDRTAGFFNFNSEPSQDSWPQASFDFQQPYAHAAYFSRLATFVPEYSVEDLRAATKRVTREKVRNFSALLRSKEQSFFGQVRWSFLGMKKGRWWKDIMLLKCF